MKAFDIVRSGWHELSHRPASQVPALDALRACAVFLVIGAHYAGSQWPAAGGVDLRLAHNPVFYFGWTGVDLFFILSGFLIGKQLWRELDRTGTVRVPRFWLRRGFRIWPLYFAMLGILTIWKGHLAQWPDWLFLSNYFTTAYARSWSLSTEEQFYIAVPLLLLLTTRVIPRRAQAWPLVGLLVAVQGVRVWQRRYLLAAGVPATQIIDRMQFPIHVHCESLLVGLLIAYLSTSRPHLFRAEGRWGTSTLGLLVVVLGSSLGMALDLLNKNIFSFLALSLIYGSLAFFVLADRSPLTRPLRSWVFYPFSRLAFGMYLNHFWFAHGSTAWTVTHLSGVLYLPVLVFLAGLVIGTAISAGVATVTFILIEHPFLMLREHWFGERDRPAHPQSAGTPSLGGGEALRPQSSAGVA